MKKYRVIICGLFMLICSKYAQAQDTAALVKEFTKLMAFSDQPFLHYNSVTAVKSEPYIQPSDTVTSNGTFYKRNDTLYIRNGEDELYIQNDLVFQVNRKRKSIWISRTADQKNVQSDPLDTKQFLALLKKKYFIRKETLTQDNAVIIFETRPDPNSSIEKKTSIDLEYNEVSELPSRLAFELSSKQLAGEDMRNALSHEGVDPDKILKKINGSEYFVRVQKMTMSFSRIYTREEDVQGMPLWTDRISYDKSSGDYQGKGIFSDYEIRKLY